MHAPRPYTRAVVNRIKIALDELNMWKAICFHFVQLAGDGAALVRLEQTIV